MTQVSNDELDNKRRRSVHFDTRQIITATSDLQDCDPEEKYLTIVELIQEFDTKYCSENATDSRSILLEFQSRIHKISKLASSADFTGIPANGYRSFLQFVIQIFQVAIKYPRHKKKKIYSFLTAIQEICHLLHHALPESTQEQSLTKDSNHPEDDEDYQSCHSNDVPHEPLSKSQQQPSSGRSALQYVVTNGKKTTEYFLTNKFCGIHFDRKISRLLRVHVMMASLFLSNSFNRTLKNSFKLNKAAHNYVEQLDSNSPYVVADYVRHLDWFPVRMSAKVLNSVSNFPKRTRTRTIKVHTPSPFTFVIEPEGVKLVPRNEIDATTSVRMRVISSGRATSSLTANKVLMFLHGGGFMGPSADAVENIFVKNWATRLPGLTIINVDFSLAPEHPFPRALQEVLDLYLWLTSGSPAVQDALSFYPKDIVVAGDSSGGNIAAALIVALQDLRRLEKEEVSKEEKTQTKTRGR